MLVQTERALEHVLHARLFPHMVFADALQLAVQPAIHPAIADMREGETLAAKHQCTQGGQQRLAAAVGLQPAILRQQQTLERLGHAPGLRRGVVVQRQRLQGRARSQAAIGALADAIGDGAQVTFTRRQLCHGGDDAQGVLVFGPRANGAGLRDTQLQAHQTRAAVAAAEPQVVLQRRLTPCRPNQASTPRLANSHRAI